jgi:hypothetical protein
MDLFWNDPMTFNLINRNYSGISFMPGILQGYGETLVLDRVKKPCSSGFISRKN